MNQKCKVCGEPAAGFHFGAFTCEGCKVSPRLLHFTWCAQLIGGLACYTFLAFSRINSYILESELLFILFLKCDSNFRSAAAILSKDIICLIILNDETSCKKTKTKEKPCGQSQPETSVMRVGHWLPWKHKNSFLFNVRYIFV